MNIQTRKDIKTYMKTEHNIYVHFYSHLPTQF